MKQKKLNIPAIIIHQMDDTQYRISGNIIGINESAETCTIKFRNGRIENNVSLEQVYINERFIDTIRKYGKKFGQWIVEKVRGLICILTPDGERDENSFFTPVNIAIKQSNGELPEFATFYPNDNIIDVAEEAGISIDAPDQDEFLADAEEKEFTDINNYWHRVMNQAGSTDMSIEESIKYVNENYYHNCMPEKVLNEVGTFTFATPTDNFGRNDLDGRWVNARELKAELFKSIDAQLQLTYLRELEDNDTNDDEDEEDFPFMTPELKKEMEDDSEYEEAIRSSIESGAQKTRIPLVWGAPGIGKTQIIRQVLKEYKSLQNRNLYLYEIKCGGLNSDSFRLPDKAKPVSIDGQEIDPAFEHAVLSWLPMYTPKSAEYNKKIEERFSRCQHISRDYMEGENEYQGGILFLDEVVRVEAQAFPIVMSICDRRINEKRLANSWGIVCAANRAEDDAGQEALSMMEQTAISDRFVHLTFIPKKEDWVAWARTAKSGSGQNIDPKIVDFVEAQDPNIWYRLFGNGGFNEEMKNNPNISNDLLNALNNSDKSIGTIAQKVVNDLIEDDENNPVKRTKEFWNPRTWEYINEEYYRMLTKLLQDNPKPFRFRKVLKASQKQFGYEGVYDDVLKYALEKVPMKNWYQFCNEYFNKSEVELEEAMNAANAPGTVKLDWINKALIIIVNTFCGGNNTLPARKMKEYFEWQDALSKPDVLKDIYNKGELVSDRNNKIQDNMYPDKADSNGMKGFIWKSNEAIISKVYKFILSKYPDGKGQAHQDALQCYEKLNTAMDSISGQLATLATKKLANAQTSIDNIFSKAFDVDVKAFDKKAFTDFFTVKTPDRFGDVKLFTPTNDTIAACIWKMINECPYLFYILNYLKYCVKIAYTSSSKKLKTKALDLYANGPGKFSEVLPQVLEFDGELKQVVSNGKGLVNNAYLKLVDDGIKKYLKDMIYLDPTQLFTACIFGALNNKKIKNFSK